MSRYEFSFEASAELNSLALRCLLRKRSPVLGPLALMLLPVLLLVLAADPGWRPWAIGLAGAAIMLLLIFLLAVQQRRRAVQRFLRSTYDHTVRVRLSDDGLHIASALGESTLGWHVIERIGQCDRVILFFYQGWNYIGMPADAIPSDALRFAQAHVTSR